MCNTSTHELHRVSTLLVDHLVSKRPEIQVLENEGIDISNDAKVNAALAICDVSTTHHE